MQAIFVGDIVMSDGKTWKEQNMEITHKIPLGSLVEISCDDKDDPESLDGVRLFVTGHIRDCDGTPLYALSHNRNAYDESNMLKEQIDKKAWLDTPTDPYAEGLIRFNYQITRGQIVSGYSEDSLKVIRLPNQ